MTAHETSRPACLPGYSGMARLAHLTGLPIAHEARAGGFGSPTTPAASRLWGVLKALTEVSVLSAVFMVHSPVGSAYGMRATYRVPRRCTSHLPAS